LTEENCPFALVCVIYAAGALRGTLCKRWERRRVPSWWGYTITQAKSSLYKQQMLTFSLSERGIHLHLSWSLWLHL